MITMNHNPHHLRTMFYRLKKLNGVLQEDSLNMIYNCAKDYKTLLIQNIMFEKYRGMYKKLNPLYEDWKEKNNASMGFWKLWGSLINAISIRDTPKGYSVGIEKNVMPLETSSMGKKKKITPVWMYAWYGEYTHYQKGIFKGIQPARPVFRPTQLEYKLTSYTKRKMELFNKIRNSWNG